MLGLAANRQIVETVPTEPNCLRQNHGTQARRLPEIAASNLSVKSDSPNSQKKPAVM